jgi:hypothetical protein
MISPGAALVSIAMLLHPVHAPITFQIATISPAHNAQVVLARNGSASLGGGTIMQTSPNAGPSTSLPPIMKIDPPAGGPSFDTTPVMKVNPQSGPSTSLPPIMRVDPGPQGSPSVLERPVMKEDPAAAGSAQILRSTEN